MTASATPAAPPSAAQLIVQQAASIHWMTPRNIIQGAREVAHEIDLDPCAAADSRHHFAVQNWTLEGGYDGLTTPWYGALTYKGLARSWLVNPPFGVSYIRGSECLSQKEYADLRKAGGDVAGFKRQTINDWAQKFINEAQRADAGDQFYHAFWVSKAAVETSAVQAVMAEADMVYFPGRRVNYLDPVSGEVEGHGATFPSLVAYFGDSPVMFKDAMERHVGPGVFLHK